MFSMFRGVYSFRSIALSESEAMVRFHRSGRACDCSAQSLSGLQPSGPMTFLFFIPFYSGGLGGGGREGMADVSLAFNWSAFYQCCGRCGQAGAPCSAYQLFFLLYPLFN